jgi:hypothetical protein
VSANDDPGDGSAVRFAFPEGLTLDEANRAKEAVSAAAITSLVTYGRHLAGVTGEVHEVVAACLGALWDKVWSRFSAEEQASGALERLATQPDISRRRAAVEDRPDELMRADRDFTASLAELVARATLVGYANLRVRDAVGAAIGGDVTIRGGRYAAGRDIALVAPGDGTATRA